ncbi:6-bladed beta-propeller [Roseivirga misakiensis]|nr:6-bladed beta-propeller [Roseivirga misakiensis]
MIFLLKMMDRRAFVQKSLTAAAGLAAMPSLIVPNRTDNLILGHNSHRYTIDTQWGKLNPEQYPVKDCHEMVQDSQGRILLLTNETKNNVLVYDKSGKLLKSWGTTYPGAHGLTLSKENGEDFLFISDNNRHQVIKTTIDGKVVMTLDYPEESGHYQKPEQYIPTEVAIGPNGDIYVADGYGQQWITQYDHQGKFIRSFGGRGTGKENLQNAHGICLDTRNAANPSLIVSAREENAFKKYSLDGEYLETIPLPGAYVCRPVIKGDYLYAAVLKSRAYGGDPSGFVTILDKENRVISNLAGSTPNYSGNTLQEIYQTIKVFLYPHDVCVDDDENLYVAQWNSGHIYPYKLTRV